MGCTGSEEELRPRSLVCFSILLTIANGMLLKWCRLRDPTKWRVPHPGKRLLAALAPLSACYPCHDGATQQLSFKTGYLVLAQFSITCVSRLHHLSNNLPLTTFSTAFPRAAHLCCAARVQAHGAGFTRVQSRGFVVSSER